MASRATARIAVSSPYCGSIVPWLTSTNLSPVRTRWGKRVGSKISSSDPSMTTAILSGEAPRATNSWRIGSVTVTAASANRILACSSAAIRRTAGWRSPAPVFVAKNSGKGSCKSSSTRAPVSRGSNATKTRMSGGELTWIRSNRRRACSAATTRPTRYEKGEVLGETSSDPGARRMTHRYPADRQTTAVFPQRFALLTQAQHMHRVAAVEQGGDLTLQTGVPEVVAANHAYPWHPASPDVDVCRCDRVRNFIPVDWSPGVGSDQRHCRAQCRWLRLRPTLGGFPEIGVEGWITMAQLATLRAVLVPFTAAVVLVVVLTTDRVTPAIATPGPVAGSTGATVPVGSNLPSAELCAAYADLVGSDREGRPENTDANRSMPSHWMLPRWSDFWAPPANRLFVPRIDGQFTGTTDQIIVWGACKWGVNTDVVRAMAMAESSWRQTHVGDYANDPALCVGDDIAAVPDELRSTCSSSTPPGQAHGPTRSYTRLSTSTTRWPFFAGVSRGGLPTLTTATVLATSGVVWVGTSPESGRTIQRSGTYRPLSASWKSTPGPVGSGGCHVVRPPQPSCDQANSALLQRVSARVHGIQRDGV